MYVYFTYNMYIYIYIYTHICIYIDRDRYVIQKLICLVLHMQLHKVNITWCVFFP